MNGYHSFNVSCVSFPTHGTPPHGLVSRLIPCVISTEKVFISFYRSCSSKFFFLSIAFLDWHFFFRNSEAITPLSWNYNEETCRHLNYGPLRMAKSLKFINVNSHLLELVSIY
jgi:hypothetical protein